MFSNHRQSGVLAGSRPFMWLGVFLIGISQVTDSVAEDQAAESNQGTRRALLIGCSVYPEPTDGETSFGRVAPLPGAENDVRRFERVLRTSLHFEDVESLAGWPEQAQSRPTAAAIRAAFERLIKRANPGDQIVILISGHGMPLPVDDKQTDLLDPANPEPDGYDEVFLPADFLQTNETIRDNQFGKWLDQIRNRGASVWIIFDCCFSGTMTRASGPWKLERDQVRGVHPSQAGISREVLQRADARAKAARKNSGLTRAAGRPVAPIEVMNSTDANAPQGQLVAFYACQPFETAREVTRPMGAELKPENRCGLLSYHLLRALSQSSTSVSYRDLARVVVSGLRAEMGSGGPTPMFEGDLETSVLGLDKWPSSLAPYLETTPAGTRLSIGELAGASPGTILTVHALDDRNWKKPVGAVRVTKSGALSSEVESVGWQKQAPVDLARLPNPARCRIVSRSWGSDASLSIALDSPPESPAKAAWDGWIKSCKAPDEGRVNWNDNRADARFLLRFTNAAGSNPKAVLLDLRPTRSKSETPSDRKTGAELVLATYELHSKGMNRLEEDLHRIRVWENVWRIASMYGDGSSIETSGNLGLKAERQESGKFSEIESATSLHAGEILSLSVVNSGYEPLWYFVFFMDGKYGIHFVRSGTIKKKSSIGPPTVEPAVKIRITGSTTGVEGFVAIGIPLEGNRAQPDYKFIAQAAVGEAGTRSAATIQPATPFERLLVDSLKNKPLSRNSAAFDDPHMATFSWVTVGDETNRQTKR